MLLFRAWRCTGSSCIAGGCHAITTSIQDSLGWLRGARWSGSLIHSERASQTAHNIKSTTRLLVLDHFHRTHFKMIPIAWTTSTVQIPVQVSLLYPTSSNFEKMKSWAAAMATTVQYYCTVQFKRAAVCSVLQQTSLYEGLLVTVKPCGASVNYSSLVRFFCAGAEINVRRISGTASLRHSG